MEIPEEIQEIIYRNDANTYVMSCYLKQEYLYAEMKEHIDKLCKFIQENK